MTMERTHKSIYKSRKDGSERIITCPNKDYIKMVEDKVWSGWCDLDGSDKQVTWADDIRRGFIEEMADVERKNEYYFANNGEENLPDDWKEFSTWMKDQSSAKFWIDMRRFATLAAFEEKFHKGLGIRRG